MKKITKSEENKLVKLFSKRIDRGIKYLDKKFEREDWLEKIDVLTLDLKNSSVCICGQVFGDFWSEFSYGEEGTPFGFSIENAIDDGEDSHWSWDLLTYLWGKKLVELKFKNGFKS